MTQFLCLWGGVFVYVHLVCKFKDFCWINSKDFKSITVEIFNPNRQEDKLVKMTFSGDDGTKDFFPSREDLGRRPVHGVTVRISGDAILAQLRESLQHPPVSV